MGPATSCATDRKQFWKWPSPIAQVVRFVVGSVAITHGMYVLHLVVCLLTITSLVYVTHIDVFDKR